MKRIEERLRYILFIALIVTALYGCGKTPNNSSDTSAKNDQSVETENQNVEKSDIIEKDSTLTLMTQVLEVPDGSGRCYEKLAVTGGDNEIVKNIIDNSMKDMEKHVLKSEGYSYASVTRNDDLLVSYESGIYWPDNSYTNYSKTINAVTGSELVLSDIIVDMEMLPRAMYAECYSVRGDYDDFISFINYLIDEDALYWSVNNYGITLIPDNEHTAAVLARGTSNPVTAYGFSIFLSYAKYPDLFNSAYFGEPGGEMAMSTLGNSKISLTDDQYKILDENGGSENGYSYNDVFIYNQDLNLIVYSETYKHLDELHVYDFANDISYTEKIDFDSLRWSFFYLAELKGKKYLVSSIAYYNYATNEVAEDTFSDETYVFRIEDKKITLTDKVSGVINVGGGEMSTDGFYMNSYYACVSGLSEDEWNSQPMYMLTDEGKIVQKK